MMARYAEATKVSSAASRDEIERTLIRYGATQFIYGWDGAAAVVGFRIGERQIKFTLAMPDRRGREITHTPETRRLRSVDAQDAAYEQAVRQRWRALALVIRAKLEAVEAGIVTMEDEFLAQTMLSDGSTVGEWAADQITQVYRTGAMPSLLPGARPKVLSDGARIADVDR